MDESDWDPVSTAPKEELAWEREVLDKLAFAAISEQRRARRWGIFFKLASLAYVGLLLWFYLPWQGLSPSMGEAHSALVDIRGVISADSEASADRVATALRAAFEDKNTAGVILRINSPGGSPVQAGYINDEIRRLRKKYPDTPLYTVISDICASGGYYIAVAGDRIYADKSSIVGSIGVLMNGFGFVDGMKKLGVERRLLTAGEHKGLMDPFSPLENAERTHIQRLLDQMHAQFIQVVKEGRGKRLKEDEKLFSGLVWSGEESVELGLVDALGSAGYVAREVIGVAEIVDFSVRKGYLERISEGIGSAVARTLSSELAFSLPR